MKVALRLLLALAIVVAAFVGLVACHYFLLWKPSLQGECVRPVTTPHITRFRGEVVGKDLWILQYRWLRRQFTPVGTKLSLLRDLPPTDYKGNIVRHGQSVGDVVIDKSGRFDFGDLPPGEYELTVTYPGQDAVGFGFFIDPSARSSDVLIDASPAYYCNCCGWNFEPR